MAGAPGSIELPVSQTSAKCFATGSVFSVALDSISSSVNSLPTPQRRGRWPLPAASITNRTGAAIRRATGRAPRRLSPLRSPRPPATRRSGRRCTRWTREPPACAVPAMAPPDRRRPGVSEKRGITACIKTDPASSSGASTTTPRACTCGSSSNWSISNIAAAVTSAASNTAMASSRSRSAIQAATMPSQASMLRTRSVLLPKRGSSMTSSRPMARNSRSAMAWIEAAIANELPVLRPVHIPRRGRGRTTAAAVGLAAGKAVGGGVRSLHRDDRVEQRQVDHLAPPAAARPRAAPPSRRRRHTSRRSCRPLPAAAAPADDPAKPFLAAKPDIASTMVPKPGRSR